MANIADYEDMPITKVVAQFMNDSEWTDEIMVSDDRSRSTVETSIGIEDQGYKLYLEANEVLEVLDVFMYAPFLVPVNRIDAMVKILNRINLGLMLGRLAVSYERERKGEPSKIQFLYRIAVEGGSLAPGQIDTITGVCFGLERFHQLLSAVALTKISEETLWEEFLDEQENDDSEENNADDGINRL